MKKMLLTGAALLTVVSGSAMAADLTRPAAPAPVYSKAPMMAPISNWTGAYIGVNAGYAWGDSEAATTTLSPPPAYFAASSVPAIAAAGAQTINPNGFTGGGQLGYNWQMGSSVFGLEA